MPDKQNGVDAQDPMETLVERVLSGRAIFFIGSGFSIDSEHNDTNTILARLLIRFLAMWRVVNEGLNANATHWGLVERLHETFGVWGGRAKQVEDRQQCLEQRPDKGVYRSGGGCVGAQLLSGEFLVLPGL
jgi:hypothetical protein